MWNGLLRLVRSRRVVVTLTTAGVVIFLTVAYWVVVVVPEQQANEFRKVLPVTTTVAMLADIADTKNSTRTTNAQIVLGFLLFLTLGAAFWRAWAADRTAKATQDSAEAALKTADSSLQAQLADRFARAVEQLGSDNLTVRLGGIYSLESIARASKAHHWPIMETLTAYVRQNAPTAAGGETTAESHDVDPLPNILAILKVIGHRDLDFNSKIERIDLSHTNLSRISLRDGDFRNAFLWGAEFKYTTLTGTEIRMANLSEADLSEALFLTVQQVRSAKWNPDYPPKLPDDIQRQLDAEQTSTSTKEDT